MGALPNNGNIMARDQRVDISGIRRRSMPRRYYISILSAPLPRQWSLSGVLGTALSHPRFPFRRGWDTLEDDRIHVFSSVAVGIRWKMIAFTLSLLLQLGMAGIHDCCIHVFPSVAVGIRWNMIATFSLPSRLGYVGR